MQSHLVEKVLDQRRAAARHHALALQTFLQPVTDAAVAIDPIDWMTTYASDNPAILQNRGQGTLIGLVLILRPLNEPSYIIYRFGLIHPGEPFAQVAAIALDGGEEFV